MIFMGIGMFLFWGALILLPVLLVKGLFQSRQARSKDQTVETPKQILEQRYARGELTREQYLLMMDDIK